jgi:hypothetical protein
MQKYKDRRILNFRKLFRPHTNIKPSRNIGVHCTLSTPASLIILLISLIIPSCRVPSYCSKAAVHESTEVTAVFVVSVEKLCHSRLAMICVPCTFFREE